MSDKKKQLFFLLILVIAVALVFVSGRTNVITPNQIYYDSVESVVELKASSSEQECSFGTAVFVGSETLVTNTHMVVYEESGENQEYTDYYVRFATEDAYKKVKLVDYDCGLDIAVLKMDNEENNSCALPIGDSDVIDYGDKVFCIGNAMNYGISISEGIISIPEVIINLDEVSRNVIQADINISSGNSGGALLDSEGKLIGITSFRTKDSMGEIVYGMGYSVPINAVMDYVNKVTGEVS